MEAGLTIDSASKSSLSSASFSFIAARQMRGDDRLLSFNRCCDAGVDSGDVEIGGNGSSSIVSAIETTFDDFRAFAASIRRFVASSRLERSLLRRCWFIEITWYCDIVIRHLGCG